MTKKIPILSWSVDNNTGLVTRLDASEVSVSVASWGCEFGDWHGYFAQHGAGRVSAEVSDARVSASEKQCHAEFEVRLQSGRFLVQCVDEICEGEIHRDYRLRALGRAKIGDFVVRHACGLPFEKAVIKGFTLDHKRRNVWHQHATSQAAVWSRALTLRSWTVKSEAPEGFDAVSYVRDEPPNVWVVHHRLLANWWRSERFVLRVARNTYEWPRSVRSLLPAAALWRLGERQKWRSPTLQVQGLIALHDNESMRICTRMALEVAR